MTAAVRPDTSEEKSLAGCWGSTEPGADRFEQWAHGRKCGVEYRAEAINSDDYCDANTCRDKRTSDMGDRTVGVGIDVLHYILPTAKIPDTTN